MTDQNTKACASSDGTANRSVTAQSSPILLYLVSGRVGAVTTIEDIECRKRRLPVDKAILKKTYESKRSAADSEKMRRMRAGLEAIQKVRAKHASKIASEAIEKAMKG